MSHKNYSLEIVSNHPEFKNKSLKKYYVDGIETIGAWGDEPFEIKFTNHSWQKVQVKLSLDGTDIFSGERADTNVSKNMWVVNGCDTLSIKAWPETNNGGASFIFTSANNSVAVHTHGDLSSRGIIAAAVFTEGHVEPIKINPIQYVPCIYPVYPTYPLDPHWVYTCDTNAAGQTFGGSTVVCNNSSTSSSTFGLCDSVVSDSAPVAAAADGRRSKSSRSLESLVSVGAGQHVDQKITYVAGLIKPVFSQSLRVRYLWWDELVEKLRTDTAVAPHASGFPADNERHINLGNTPRRGQRGVFRRAEEQVPVFTRI
jgi:hypothetical protein